MRKNENTYAWALKSLTDSDNFIAKLSRIENLLEKYTVVRDTRFTGKPAVGVDLDRTMIYSAASMNLSKMDATTFLRVAEMHEGKPFAYMTSVAYSMMEIINNSSYLIPVTTRTVEQYRRIRIPGMTETNFLPSTAAQYAVTSNGGKILVNGEEDRDWSDYIQKEVADKCAPIKDVNALLKPYDSESWLIKRRVAEGLFTYLVLDRAETPQHVLESVKEKMTEWNWSVSMQGRKFYCVPAIMTKGIAFDEIITRLGADYSMAAGDSLLDIPMLERADFAVRPAHGELDTANYTADNLSVTENTGILAGEEIVARILARIYAGS